MSIKCVHCGYERQSSDIWHNSECPKCGISYSQLNQKKETQDARKPNTPRSSGGSAHKDRDMSRDMLKEIRLLIRSHYGLIWIKTIEEARIKSLMKYLADSMNLGLFIWTPSTGLRRFDLDNSVYGTHDPKQALSHIEHSRFSAIYYFEGLGPYLSDPALKSGITSLAGYLSGVEGAMVMAGDAMDLPDTAMLHTAEVVPPAPGRKDFEDLLNNIIRDITSRMHITVDISDHDMKLLLNNLQGLTLLEAEKVLTRAIIEDRSLHARDIQKIIDAKKTIVERDGLLEYFPVERSLADIADLKNLKQWLDKRKSIIVQPEQAASYGLVFPKGILLLGVPGSGKSLCAKAVAMEWKLPLLKMDPSNLYNKYIGESEKNFKRAMETAEKMSPVVLWIDEIEKAFSSGSDADSGVSQRVLGIFLSWMQERKAHVFVVATSNNVKKLPPEFLRKGRFDEIFFVDLPDEETRAHIFDIHLKQRGHDPAGFDLQRMAMATEGFSGAEIEQVIVSSLYTSFANSSTLSTELLIEESEGTMPLSVTRAEHVQSLRDWARDRTVSAQ